MNNEKTLKSIVNLENLEYYKLAGEIHSRVYDFIQPYLKHGIKILDICELIENKIREYSREYSKKSHKYHESHNIGNILNDSIAFPTGISINHVAAHYTPHYGEETILKSGDVCKIDYGVHINGCIVDSAFTVNLDNRYAKLLEASRIATDTVVKNLGVDARFHELSRIAQEIVTSYEIEIDNKIIPLKPIDNLAGHNILPWTIHAGKYLHSVVKENDNQTVEENEVIAVEVFVSTGEGTTILDENKLNYSHYMLKNRNTENTGNTRIPLFNIKRVNDVSRIIQNNFSTLAFCPRFIDYFNGEKQKNYGFCLDYLFQNNIINSYPPLIEPDKDALIAQFEKSVFVGDTKIIL